MFKTEETTIKALEPIFEDVKVITIRRKWQKRIFTETEPLTAQKFFTAIERL